MAIRYFRQIFGCLFLVFVLTVPAFAADPYWVDDNGAATWANAQSATPLSGTACASLSTANSNASAGDTVYFRAGSYNGVLQPSNSGSSGNRITFQAYNSDVVVIDRNETTPGGRSNEAIYIDGKSYITVSGIDVTEANRGVRVINNADYNIVEDFEFTYIDGGIQVQNGADYNIFRNGTMMGEDDPDDYVDGNGIITESGTESHYNLYDNIEIYNFGHSNIEHRYDHPYSIFRDLTVHHAGDKNYNSNDYLSEYCLFENCKFYNANAGTDDSGNASFTRSGNGQFTVRYTEFYYTGSGTSNPVAHLNLKHYSGESSGDKIIHARIYNNTITKSSSYASYNGMRGQFWESSTYCHEDIIAKNNIITNVQNYEVFGDGTTGCEAWFDWIVTNNLIRGSADNQDILADLDGADQGYYTLSEADSAYADWSSNIQGDPLFTDAEGNDFTLQSGSPARNAGTYLTTVHANDTSSGTDLIVSDTYYFQDGYNGQINADYIAVGATVATAATVQISSISHGQPGTITTASEISRSDGDYVWLYKDSSGTVVLYGSAPDIGANEYIEGVTIAATDSSASEEGPDTGTFRITRSGSTSGNLVVNFTLGGTASSGDYDEDLSGGTITITDGNAYVDQTITPTDDSDVEGSEILTITIAADSYEIGSPSQASITIADNESAEGEMGLVIFGSGTGSATRDSSGTGSLVK